MKFQTTLQKNEHPFLDVFEPMPTWHPSRHRSPLQHQRSLSSIVYQDYQASLLDSTEDLTLDGLSMFTADEGVEPVDQVMRRLAIPQSTVWKDYKPQSIALNQALETQRVEIYQAMRSTLENIQSLELRMDQIKRNYQVKTEARYRALHSDLVDQCHQVIQEARDYNHSRLEITPVALNEKVRLNVGGSLFETSYSTLCRDSHSLLAAMFSGRHSLSVEPGGAYFLDRDPLHFRLVLNYLRDLRVPPAILEDRNIKEELLQEAAYYRIQGLVDLLTMKEDQKPL